MGAGCDTIVWFTDEILCQVLGLEKCSVWVFLEGEYLDSPRSSRLRSFAAGRSFQLRVRAAGGLQDGIAPGDDPAGKIHHEAGRGRFGHGIIRAEDLGTAGQRRVAPPRVVVARLDAVVVGSRPDQVA